MDSKEPLRVYICGPHNTGKTTLLNDLGPHLDGVNVIEEVARGVIREHGWTRDEYLPDVHPDVFIQLNREILQRQIEVDLQQEDQACISDRGLDPIVYASFYVGKEAKEEMYALNGFQKWIQRMSRSLVFLISPHKECILDDNVRLASSLDELKRFHAMFQEELNYNRIPFYNVTVLDRQARVKQVAEAIKEFRTEHA